MAQKGPYRGYAVKVWVDDGKGENGLRRRDMKDNMKKILSGTWPPSSWREMDAMTCVEIATLLNTGLLSANLKQGHFPTYDIDSNPITMRDRDAVILRTLWLSKSSIPGPETPPLMLTRREDYGVAQASESEYLYTKESTRPFLNGTTWYGPKDISPAPTPLVDGPTIEYG